MNAQFNKKSSGNTNAAFHMITQSIDYSDRKHAKSKRRINMVSTDDKIISEEELLQFQWQF